MDHEPLIENNPQEIRDDRFILRINNNLKKIKNNLIIKSNDKLKISNIIMPLRQVYIENNLPRLNDSDYNTFESTMARFANLYPQIREVEIPRSLDRDQVVRIGEAVDGLAAVRRAFSTFPHQELDSLLSKVEKSLLTENESGKKRELIASLFSSPDSRWFGTDIEHAGIEVDQLPELFFSDGIFTLISVMLEHPEKYRMQLGVILSQVDLKKIPEDLRKKMKPIMSGLEFSLETERDHWYLCGTAEPRLIRSMAEGSSIAIGEKGNPYLLVKFRGKMSALCLQDFTTQDGKVFVRGNWYSPTESTRDALKEAFEEGKGRIALQKGSWVLMRPVKASSGKNEEEIIFEALLYAKTVPDVYPNNEITVEGNRVGRKDFRRLTEEV